MKRNFDTLDGLRGVAALAVMTVHIWHPTDLKTLLPAAYLGVDFFFALSGFVLAHAYSERLRTSLPLSEFMTIRMIRLWPLYALATVAGAMFLAAPLKVTAPALFFIPLPGDLAFPLNSPAWSLFAELFVNLIYAAIARFLTNRVLAVVVAISAIGLVAAATVNGQVAGGDNYATAYLGLARVMYGFFAGVAVYRFWRWRPALKAPAWIFPPMLLAMFTVRSLDLAWALVGLPLLVYFAASAAPRGMIRTACLKLGVASYGVYVLQMAVIGLIPREALQDKETLLLFAGMICLALLLDRIYDRPVRAWLSARLLRPPATIKSVLESS